MSVQLVTKPKRKRGVRNVALTRCAYCSEIAAREVFFPQAYPHGEEMIVIENVPSMICDSCGQHYLMDSAWKFVNEVLKHPDQHTQKRMVKVATYT
jgi:uncharacterized protein with PIN domain